MTTAVTDVKAALTEGLTELRLPTVRHCYEETARLAERETLSYERYLLQLVTRECEDRQRKPIERLLHQSRIPAEKALSNFRISAPAVFLCLEMRYRVRLPILTAPPSLAPVSGSPLRCRCCNRTREPCW